MIDGIGGFDRIGKNFSPNPEKTRKRSSCAGKKSGNTFEDAIKLNPSNNFQNKQENGLSQYQDFQDKKKANADKSQNLDGLMNLTATNFHRQAKLSALCSDIKAPQQASRYLYSEDVSDYSINAIIEKIVKYAVFISYDETGNYSGLTDAITAGFQKANQLYGQPLPEICKYTYDEIMKKLLILKNTLNASED